MRDLESRYLRSKVFGGVYPEVRAAFEEFLGDPLAGLRAMSLPTLRSDGYTQVEEPIPAEFEPERALEVIVREAARTRLVIWGEEHHLSQTRSPYEGLLKSLWPLGYRYLAAETFEPAVMDSSFRYPDYKSGFYLRDPVFACAVRTAREMGYTLIAYETRERGPADDPSFRDRTQAETIKSRTFDIDTMAKVLIIAGRGHVAEEAAPDGWTPMATVLKRLTGIDPLTLYAPTMSERLTGPEEHPMYRYATSRQLLNGPTIFVRNDSKAMLGSGSFDAYIFWPRTVLVRGRPDWLSSEMGRRAVEVPPLPHVEGLALVQAFYLGHPPTVVPVDQILIESPNPAPVLMLPGGDFWLRRIDQHGNVAKVDTVQVR